MVSLEKPPILKAFIGSEMDKPQALALAQQHFDQDQFMQGTYGNRERYGTSGFRGCSVGCMSNGKHKNYPHLFGVVPEIAYFSDEIFERLSPEDAKLWTLQLFNAIQVGSDTHKIFCKFVLSILPNEPTLYDSELSRLTEKVANLYLNELNELYELNELNGLYELNELYEFNEGQNQKYKRQEWWDLRAQLVAELKAYNLSQIEKEKEEKEDEEDEEDRVETFKELFKGETIKCLTYAVGLLYFVSEPKKYFLESAATVWELKNQFNKHYGSCEETVYTLFRDKLIELFETEVIEP